MTLAVTVALALALRAACDRSLPEIGRLHLRGEALFLVVLTAYAALPPAAALFGAPREVVVPVWVGLMVLLFLLCVLNSPVAAGFPIMAVGVGANLAVIAANGHMPVSRAAAMSVGGAVAASRLSSADFFHAAAHSGTRLTLLSDILPLPGLPGLRSVLSAGDVLMLVGMLVVIVAFVTPRQD